MAVIERYDGESFCRLGALEIPGGARAGQGGVVVLPHLVPGHGRCALRQFADNLAHLLGNQRHHRHCVAIERWRRSSGQLEPLADVSAVSDALLRFKLFRPHQRSGVHSRLAVPARRTPHISWPLRGLRIIRFRLEEDSTRRPGLRVSQYRVVDTREMTIFPLYLQIVRLLVASGRNELVSQAIHRLRG